MKEPGRGSFVLFPCLYNRKISSSRETHVAAHLFTINQLLIGLPEKHRDVSPLSVFNMTKHTKLMTVRTRIRIVPTTVPTNQITNTTHWAD